MAVSNKSVPGGGPLNSFHGLRFHSSRYPVKPSDKAKKFDPTVHNHVVFVRKNKFFEVPLATVEGRELTAAELEVWVVLHIELRHPWS